QKASRRDLGAAVALKRHAATTVSATMALAHAAGIRVFATGGLGGAHRECGAPRECGTRNAERGVKAEDTASEPESGFSIPHSEFRAPHSGEPFDISADLTELARTPVLVVCAGAKSLLHLPRTLEILETLGVPVVGYRTDEFPAFYVRDHHPPLPVSARVETPDEAAALFAAHVRMGGAGVVLAQPCVPDLAIPHAEFETWLAAAAREASAAGVTGARVTPFMLGRIAELSGGRTLAANRALIVANARLAAEVAVALAGQEAGTIPE
ncbi:MAG: pseudouridine-5'-phosphate glycosidase, partial [Gemmataceae bacterium]|nr:pseudouridine-5'-phosphate glycosidase [Gemmataceae bacterium]